MGCPGSEKYENGQCFRFSDRFGIAMLLTANYFNVLVFRKALKAQISSSKIDFGSSKTIKRLILRLLFGVVCSNFVFGVFLVLVKKFKKLKTHKKSKNEAKNLPTVVFLLHFLIFRF